VGEIKRVVKKTSEFMQKWGVIVVISFLIVEGLALKLYNHHDYLHFQLDQARDAYITQNALENGAGELPLMGPRAAGSFLRLGPVFYYFQYFSAFIFQSTNPSILALPDLVFSILLIPLLYLFLRLYFGRKWSILLVFLISHSLFLFTYSRFAWNPNSLPFFSLLTFYAWLKYWREREKGRDAIKWLALTAFSVGIAIQLHFTSFIIVPIIILLSLALFWFSEKLFSKKKKKLFFSSKEILVAVLIFLFTQIPIMTNELLSKGTNTKEFFATFQEKSEKGSSYTFLEKVSQNVWTYSKGYWLVVAGNQNIDYPVLHTRGGMDIRCDHLCRQNLVTNLISGIFWILSLGVLGCLLYRKTKKLLKSSKSRYFIKTKDEWRFLTLLSIWILISWWTFFSLSFSIPPRFFLLPSIAFWIMAGIFLHRIAVNRVGKWASLALAFFILLSNLVGIFGFYESKWSASRYELTEYPKDLILKEVFPVTLSQEEQIVDWMSEKYLAEKVDDKNYLLFWAPSRHYRPIRYLLDNKELTKGKSYYFSNYPQYTKASYFAVLRTSKPHSFFDDDRKPLFAIMDQQTFGTLTVYHLVLTGEGYRKALEKSKGFIEKKNTPKKDNSKCLLDPKPTCRFIWSDVIN